MICSVRHAIMNTFVKNKTFQFHMRFSEKENYCFNTFHTGGGGVQQNSSQNPHNSCLPCGTMVATRFHRKELFNLKS
jgi:hypothetical protein